MKPSWPTVATAPAAAWAAGKLPCLPSTSTCFTPSYALKYMAWAGPQPVNWAPTPRKIALVPSVRMMDLRQRKAGTAVTLHARWIVSRGHGICTHRSVSRTVPFAPPATCIRVLMVSNGNITQCSAIPAHAPLTMYLRAPGSQEAFLGCGLDASGGGEPSLPEREPALRPVFDLVAVRLGHSSGA